MDHSNEDSDMKLKWNTNWLDLYDILDKKGKYNFELLRVYIKSVYKAQDVIPLLSMHHESFQLVNYLQISPVNLVIFEVSWGSLREEEQDW